MQFHSPRCNMSFRTVFKDSEEDGRPCDECIKLRTELSNLRAYIEQLGVPLVYGPQGHHIMKKGPSPMPKARATVWESTWANSPDNISPARNHTNYVLKPGHEVKPSIQHLYKEIGRLSRELDIANGVIQTYKNKRLESSENQMEITDPEINTDVFRSTRIDKRKTDRDWEDRQKIAELYKSLYTKEWSNALKVLTDCGLSEKDGYRILLNTLLETYGNCETTSIEQLQSIIDSSSLVNARGVPNNAGSEVNKAEVKRYRKRIAQSTASLLKQVYITKTVKSLAHLPQGTRDNRQLQEFTGKCVEVTWYMCIMEPPMVFHHTAKKGSKFDTSKFNFYNIEGQKIDYVIWPQLLSSASGPSICKGLANAVCIYTAAGESYSVNGDHLGSRVSVKPAAATNASK